MKMTRVKCHYYKQDIDPEGNKTVTFLGERQFLHFHNVSLSAKAYLMGGIQMSLANKLKFFFNS